VSQRPDPQRGRRQMSMPAMRCMKAMASFGGFQFSAGIERAIGLGETMRLRRGAEQAVVADALEPGRQNMLKEASYELPAGDSDDAFLAAFIGPDSQQDIFAFGGPSRSFPIEVR